MSSETIALLLCNFDDKCRESNVENIKKIWSGKWSIDNFELCKELLATGLKLEQLKTALKIHVDNGSTLDNIVCLALSSFLTFCEQNWNTDPGKLDLQDYFGVEWPSDIEVTSELQKDSEPVHVNIIHPELLYFSMQIFNALYLVEQKLIYLWWHFRSLVVHQRILEDNSATIYNELELMIAKLSNEANMLGNRRLAIILYAEIAQAYVIYGRAQEIEEYLNKATESAGLKLELTGVLGKRTKFQQATLPLLVLTSQLDSAVERPSAEESHGDTELPQDIALEDDVRLNKIQYLEEIRQADLPSLEQTLCMLTVQYLQISQPKDDFQQEGLMPYVEAVVSQRRGAWSTRVAALLARCRLEAGHRRSAERALAQCEAIVNAEEHVANTSRLSYLWASGLPPAWTWRQQLAELSLGLGLVQAALEEYTRLQLWEDVMECYTMLQQQHKVAEILQQQLDVNPTVKLYCLLGDATDDVSCYEKAWALSDHKSSRAQRHWGDFLFEREQYAECIPHFEKSLEINSLQEGVWLKLGYAARTTEDWALTARACRRYTYLQPATFEAWDNLATAYLQQGDKPQAHRALQDALGYHYDNWKLWEKIILVSMDTGHFDDVVRGARRLRDLRTQFAYEAVLGRLTRAALEAAQDAEKRAGCLYFAWSSLHLRVLELYRQIAKGHPEKPKLWDLYSDLNNRYNNAQRLQMDHGIFTQVMPRYARPQRIENWLDPETCKKVIELAQKILEVNLQIRQESKTEGSKHEADEMLSSVRLTGEGVIRAAEVQNWPDTADALEQLKATFNNVTEYMKSIM